MFVVYPCVKVLKPSDKAWVDARIFPGRLLVSRRILLFVDKGHDLREANPVRVQKKHRLVIWVDDLLESAVRQHHPPPVLS